MAYNRARSLARSGSFSEPAGGGVADASNGYDVYMVWFWPGGKSECECAVYRALGKGCKHISAVRDSIKRSSKAPGVVSFFGSVR
jgi:hypothetical protein